MTIKILFAAEPKLIMLYFEGSDGCVRGVSGVSGAGTIWVDSASATYAPHMTVGALKLLCNYNHRYNCIILIIIMIIIIS